MKGNKYILIAAAVILLMGFILTFAYNMNNQVEKAGGFIIPKTTFSDGTRDLTSRIKDKSEPLINEFSAYAAKSDLDSISGDAFHILVYRLNSQAYEVYFNDTYIGTVGDMVNGRSHTYNSSNSFAVSKSLIGDYNKITIRTYGIYMTGLETNSVGVTDEETARKINEILHLLSSGFTMTGIGAIVFGILISLLTYMRSDRKNKALVYLSVAVAFLGIYSLEYLNLPYLSFSYILFKKIIMCSLYACIFFFGMAFREYYRKWHLVAVSSTIFIIVILAAIFTRTLITFKYIYDITYFGIAVSFVVWFFHSLFADDDSEERYVFAASSLMLLILAFSDILQMVIIGGVISTSIINHVLIIIFILVMLMNVELHRRNVRISSESSQRSHFYHQSITDQLTGVYNKNHMLKILEDEIPPLSVAMLDLDKFKEINDRYGHQCGDYVLEHVAAKMKDEFRDTDIIGRYGGDEFMVILIGCSERNAFDIMNRFRMHLEMDKIEYDGNEIKVTTSVGISYIREKSDIKKMIKNADEALYRAKDSGRNRVSI
jgi:diguanylate cyclase (GGDEF)-like protein